METNQEKGLNYEIQIRDYIISALHKNAYLWSDAPETILINCGIIGSHNEHRLIRKEKKENGLTDTGVDIIQVDSNTECSLVQCKNGYKNGLTIIDLAGFMCWMAAMDKINGYIYYTSKHLSYIFAYKIFGFILPDLLYDFFPFDSKFV
jgi:hypothetical protein